MPQKYAFTTAAMAAALEDTPVSYEDLAEIEKDFDDAETEIIRQQVNLTAPLYDRRHKTVAQIPNFWPLVLEQAPPDIDQYIQPSDSALLLSSLTSLSVHHFQITPVVEENGDPRSFAIRWAFAENEYFEDEVLEKRFWHRRAMDGWTGLVSEPVKIRWRKGKDLTSGMLDLVCAAWEQEQAENESTRREDTDDKRDMTEQQKALKKKMDQTGMGGLSFFAWFGFIGRRVSARESAEATRRETERREMWRQGQKIGSPGDESGAGEVDNINMTLEIFPDGDELALAFKDDLWPDAIKYFTQAQEQDALSDADFESDDESSSRFGSEGNSEDGRPTKKRRA